MRRLILAALVACATVCSAQAQDHSFPTPGNATVGGYVPMCLNQSGQAVPCAYSPITSVATGTTGAVTATLAAPTTGATNYICGFDVSAAGGTATVSPITVAGLLGGSFTYQGISAGGTPFQHTFTPCVPASAINTAITVSTTADGTATAVDVQAWGYRQ
jgi:hypothetical protein